MPQNAHNQAAEHHDNAAKSHRTAADFFSRGNDAWATNTADKAYEQSTKAHPGLHEAATGSPRLP